MIPLRDDNPTHSFAFVTVGLIAVNALVFLYQLTLAGPRELEAFFQAYALVPARLSSDPSPLVFGTVFSSMFMHGGWLHLIGNMLYLWIFGNNIEDAVGHMKFIIFYLLCGIGAAAAQVLAAPHSPIPMVGASGAVAGVLGAYLLLFPRARVLVLFPIWIFIRLFYVPAVVVLGFWFVLQLFSGWLSANASQAGGGVAWWAHIGGFVVGMVWIPVFKKRRVKLFR
jgi:membrane associated rhomboid family serine protease